MTNKIHPDLRNSPLFKPEDMTEEQRDVIKQDDDLLLQRKELNQFLDSCKEIRSFRMSAYTDNLLLEAHTAIMEFKNEQVDRQDELRIKAGELGLDVIK